MAAPVGDDVYGEDPSVGELEDRVARLLGHEAGLFCVSGSLANLLGVRLLVEPGQEVLCDVQAHIARAELGAHAAVHGLTMRTFPSSRGRLDADRGHQDHLAERRTLSGVDRGGRGREHPQLRRRDRSRTSTSCGRSATCVVIMESATTSTVRGCGTPMPRPGSRSMTYGRLFDTVSVCFSKGMGAPVGSVLVSSAANIARARVLRKRLGGGLAAGRYAGRRLHATPLIIICSGWSMIMRRLAPSVRRWPSGPPAAVDLTGVETNIVIIDTGDHPAAADRRGRGRAGRRRLRARPVHAPRRDPPRRHRRRVRRRPGRSSET